MSEKGGEKTATYPWLWEYYVYPFLGAESISLQEHPLQCHLQSSHSLGSQVAALGGTGMQSVGQSEIQGPIPEEVLVELGRAVPMPRAQPALLPRAATQGAAECGADSGITEVEPPVGPWESDSGLMRVWRPRDKATEKEESGCSWDCEPHAMGRAGN